MKEFAELITAIAALISALFWPITLIIFIAVFGREIKAILRKFPSMLDRAESVNLVGVVEAKLNQLVDASDSKTAQKGTISSEEVRVAASLQAQVKANVIPQGDIYEQMDRLCIQYDTVRRAMRGGAERTREMTRILAIIHLT